MLAAPPAIASPDLAAPPSIAAPPKKAINANIPKPPEEGLINVPTPPLIKIEAPALAPGSEPCGGIDPKDVINYHASAS